MALLHHPLSTEKSIRLMESANTLVFIVDDRATKSEIKKQVETTFKVKIKSINTTIGPDSKKKAFVKLTPEYLAMDVATQLGLL